MCSSVLCSYFLINIHLLSGVGPPIIPCPWSLSSHLQVSTPPSVWSGGVRFLASATPWPIIIPINLPTAAAAWSRRPLHLSIKLESSRRWRFLSFFSPHPHTHFRYYTLTFQSISFVKATSSTTTFELPLNLIPKPPKPKTQPSK